MRRLRVWLVRLVSSAALLALAAVAGVWWLLQPDVEALPLPAPLVAITTAEGRARLEAAGARADYGPLSASFRAQVLRSYCGVASSVMVLRAFGREVDQHQFFGERTRAVRSRLGVTLGGMTLADLAGLLRAYGVQTVVRHADEFDADELRLALVRNLAEPRDFLLVNYQREVLGQARVGHISPVAAFDAVSDSVLILDTAAYHYPFTWVPVELLHAAMAAEDSVSGRPRGYVEVRDAP